MLVVGLIGHIRRVEKIDLYRETNNKMRTYSVVFCNIVFSRRKSISVIKQGKVRTYKIERSMSGVKIVKQTGPDRFFDDIDLC